MCPTMLDFLRCLISHCLTPGTQFSSQPFFSAFFFSGVTLWCLSIFMCTSLCMEQPSSPSTQMHTIQTNSTCLSGDPSETIQFGLGIFPCILITLCAFPIVPLLHSVIIACLLLCLLHLQIMSNCVYNTPGGSVVKNLPANARDSGLISGSGRYSGVGNVATHSSILARVIPWKGEP